MKLRSSSFQNGGKIPAEFTGTGEDKSPSLTWSEEPAATKSFAMICEDPDAPHREGKDHPFVHWVMFDIPPTIHYLPEKIPHDGQEGLNYSGKQGKNSFGNIGYNGPMPPVGHGIHDYLFTLHALDRELGLGEGISKDELLKAMEGHVLHSTKIIGSFERKADESSEDRAAG